MPRYRPEDFEATDEELKLAREQAEAAGYGETGQALGGIAGGALGALGFLGGPALGGVTTGLGASLGGMAGGLIGSGLGAQKGDAASERLAEMERVRAERLKEYGLRQQALDALQASR